MFRFIFFIITASLLSTNCIARTWPATFSRQTYHTFYVEQKFVESMPFNLRGFNYVAGKPAILHVITAYTQFGLHPQNSIDPPRYVPAFICGLKGNVPVYDAWTFVVAVNTQAVKSCN